MMESSGSLEEELEVLKRKAQEIRGQRGQLKKVEELGALLEEHLILDNRYTEHSTVGLAQAYDQLDQLAMRMQHNLEQQIQARNQSGVSEEALREFSMMFKHFDKVLSASRRSMLKFLAAGKDRSPGSPAVQVVSARPGLRPAHG